MYLFESFGHCYILSSSQNQLEKIVYAYNYDFKNCWYSSFSKEDREVFSKSIQYAVCSFFFSLNNQQSTLESQGLLVEDMNIQSWWSDGKLLHLLHEDYTSSLQLRCCHLSSLWKYCSPLQKSFIVINPLNHPILPCSLRSPEEQQSHLSPPITEFEYSRLQVGNPEDQVISIASNLSVRVPSYRTFLPVLGFSTTDCFYDIPIPSVVDFVVSTREVIEGIGFSQSHSISHSHSHSLEISFS